MTEWVDVSPVAALAHGEHALVDIDGIAVAVFNIDGEYYAIEDVCTHDGAEIASGDLIGSEIMCPRHGARFCVKTGVVQCPPAYENVNCFPTRVLDGKIQVTVG